MTNFFQPVQQRRNGCLAACISMVTGVDYDILHPTDGSGAITTEGVGFGSDYRYATVKDLVRNWGRGAPAPLTPAFTEVKRERKDVFTFEPNDRVRRCTVVPWRQLKKMYRENYGIELKMHRKKPKGISIRHMDWSSDSRFGHVVVEFPDGRMFDPGPAQFKTPEMYRWSGMTLKPLWITAKVIRNA